jgi:tetratricopeptide (TPR) repeat protein
MKLGKLLGYMAALLLLHAGLANSGEQQLGNFSFPNSGASEAQSAFLRGVGALHSFEFDEARIAFEEAQEIDPSFALAYWGQAMSDNHPLWRQQDMDAASAALNKLAPDFQGRLRKAPTAKEKAYLTAIETLYFSPGDKLQRDFAYAEHMARMHERWPDDHEISIFYALSLLGTVRRGDEGFRRQALAASICQSVFAENENHPGAAHFIIHSFDDPDHAILALPAAKVYAGIAPAAAHALHMPSHIFVQLGMWQEVVDSNIEAYDAAITMINKYGLTEGREDFHTLSWLAYANLMLGQYDRAAENLGTALGAVERNPGTRRVLGGYLQMRGRHMVETGQWEDVTLDTPESVEGSNAHWVSVVGMSAAHRGDMETATAAIDRLEDLQKQATADGKTYDAKVIAVLEKEVMAVTSLFNGDKQRAVEIAREAAEMEMREMNAPSGPPVPMKPAVELYGDILMAADRPVEALVAYERSMQWIPQRTPSILGLANAANAAGDNKKAEEMYTKIKEMPGANPSIR